VYLDRAPDLEAEHPKTLGVLCESLRKRDFVSGPLGIGFIGIGIGISGGERVEQVL
jgi:hypothetical protein